MCPPSPDSIIGWRLKPCVNMGLLGTHSRQNYNTPQVKDPWHLWWFKWEMSLIDPDSGTLGPQLVALLGVVEQVQSGRSVSPGAGLENSWPPRTFVRALCFMLWLKMPALFLLHALVTCYHAFSTRKDSFSKTTSQDKLFALSCFWL